MAFITVKEVVDIELSHKLCQEGKIAVLGVPFKALQRQEIDRLIARGVFKFI